MTPEQLAEFVEVVAEMRQAQKDYFKARQNPDARARMLRRARNLESRVDQYLDREKVPGLFT